MKDISISKDIIPVGELKAKMAQYLKSIQEDDSTLVITQNGKPAGVLLSPKKYDEYRHAKLFIESVARGLSDSEKGETISTLQLKNLLKDDFTKQFS